MARAGASSPRTLARSFGVGFAVGLCPVVGLPMPVLFLVLAASKFSSSSMINAPALLVGNAVSLPAELLMLGPYLRTGRILRETFYGGAEGKVNPSSSSLVAAAREHARRSVPAALFVWAATVPLVALGVARALEPWLAGAVALSSGSRDRARSSSSGVDVELAPLAAPAALPSPSSQAAAT